MNEKRKRNENEQKKKRNENEKKEKRNKKKKRERRENINLFIQINKQRDSKTNQGKTSQDEIYIDSLQIIINDNDNNKDHDNDNDNHYSMNGDGMKIISQ